MRPPREAVRLWRSGALNKTLFLAADYRHQRFAAHAHEEYAIGIIEGGCQAFTYDRVRRLDIPAGSVALISPGIVHSGWPGAEQGWRYRMLYPSPDTVADAARDIFGTSYAPSFHRPVVADVRLGRMLGNLHSMSEETNPDPLAIERHYLAVIHHSFRAHAGFVNPPVERRHQPGLTRARDIMEERFDCPLTLAELADVAGLGKFALLRQFKARFGLPPHAWLKQLRIRRASSAILDGMALAEAATVHGFADQAHMTRSFRAVLGFTPGALLAAR